MGITTTDDVTISSLDYYIRKLNNSDVIKGTTLDRFDFSTRSSDKVTNTTYVYNADTITTLDQTSENMHALDHDILLRRENEYESKALTPVTVYLVILMVTGILGNTIVLYIYKFRFRRSTSRVFILCLAIFDLITCLLGVPYHILDMMYPYLFVWDEVCKIMSFALTFTILASVFILDIIAIDRYRKICKPFEKQLSSKGSKRIGLVTAIGAMASAVPILFLYGSTDVPTARFPNITGTECYISADYADTDFPLVFNGFILLIFIVSVVILLVFYTRVGATVWKRRKITESSRETKLSISSQSTPSTSVVHVNIGQEQAKLGHVHFSKEDDDFIVQKSNAVTHTKDSSPPYKTTISNLAQSDRGFSKKRLRLMSEQSSFDHDSSTSEAYTVTMQIPKRHFTSKKHRRTLRITVMLFVITVIFVVSFLPYLVISFVDGMDEEFWDGMPIGEIVIFNLLLRTYFINNMINPIIYWFLDHKFKEEVCRLFGNFWSCKIPKYLRRRNKNVFS